MSTVRYTLNDIEYDALVPDVVDSKHVTAPLQQAALAKTGLPNGAQMSLSSAALGLCHRTAVRVVEGVPQEEHRGKSAPAFGSLRNHGMCPYTFGGAVERHFVVNQRTPEDQYWLAAHACLRAMLGLTITAAEVEEAVGNSEGTRTSPTGSASASSTAETPSTT